MIKWRKGVEDSLECSVKRFFCSIWKNDEGIIEAEIYIKLNVMFWEAGFDTLEDAKDWCKATIKKFCEDTLKELD